MYMATNELIDNAVKRGIISYNTAFAIKEYNIRLSQNGFPIIYNLRHLRKILKIQKQDQDKFFGFGRNQYHKFYIPKNLEGKGKLKPRQTN